MRLLALPMAMLLVGAVTARAQDDHVNSRSTAATPITVTGPLVPGRIEVPGDRDWFRVSLTAGRTYSVFTTNLAAGMDSVISVYTPSNSLVGTDDDGGGGLASRLTFVAATTGNYYVRLAHYSSTRTGTYSIGVGALATPKPTPTPTPPDAPTGVAARALGSTRVDVTWTDASTTETSFAVERRLAGQLNFDPVGAVAAGVTTFADTAVYEGATFEYRVLSVNAAGRSPSTTTASATTFSAAPRDVAAVARSSTTVAVTWTDASGGETGYRVERRPPGGAFSVRGTVAANVTTFTDTSVTEGASFEYRVLASNAAGLSASAVATVSVPPAAPANLVATRVGGAQVDLSWTDASSIETGFRVERLDFSSHTLTTLANLPANAAAFTDATATINSHYEYRVVAVGSGAESVSAVNVSTIMIGPAQALTAQAFPPADVHLTWWDSSNETGFRVERRLAGTTAFTALATTPADVTRYVDVGVPTPGTFEYRVVSTNGVVDGMPSRIVSATVSLPAPTGLTALALSTTEVRLSWIDNSTTETGFKIEREPNGFVIATVGPDVTTFVDPGCTPGSTYQYRVVAANGATARSPRGDAVRVTMPSQPLPGAAVLPDAPTGLVTRAIGPNTIELSWTDNATNEVQYKLERRQVMPSEFRVFAQRAVLPADTTTFVDTGLIAGFRWEYRVTAIGAAGSSLPSDVAGSTTPVLQPPTDLRTGVVAVRWVELTWVDTTTTETGFRIERAGHGSTQYFVVGRVGANVTSFVDTTADTSGRYDYRIVAETIGGESNASPSVLAATPPVAPPSAASGLRAVAVSPFRVELSWVDHATTESQYWIERRRGTDPFRVVGSTTPDATTFTDLRSDYTDAVPMPGRTYEYRVFAANEGGRSASSEVVAVTTPIGPALRNGDFETGDVRGWTDDSGQPLEVVRFDVDGDGAESWALLSAPANFSRRQAVVLVGGGLELRADVAGTSGANGLVSLFFDGVLLDVVDFNAVGDVRRTLRGSVAQVPAGPHEVRLEVQGASQGQRFVDDVVLSGSAVPAAPAAPTTLGITAATTGRVDLAWADRSSNETGFRIERSARGGGSFVEVGRTGANVSTFSDTTVVASAAYEYRVRATNESGDSPPSNTVGSALPLRPAAPSSFMAWTTGPALVTLTWADRSALERGYVIERRLQGGGSAYSQLGVTAPNATTFSDIWAAPLTAYDYRVFAWNDAGQSTPVVVSATTFTPAPAPGPASNLVATMAGAAGVRLSWSTGSGSDTGVRIYRDIANQGWWIVGVAPAGATTFLDTQANPDVLHTYNVVRMSAGGDSPLANEVTISTGPRTPAASTDLRAVARDAYRTQLTWTDVADDETGYRVERRARGAGTFTSAATLSVDATSWLDQDLLPGTTMEYRVIATRPGADAAASVAAATSPPAGTLMNGDFETRDRRGWTLFGPTTHAVQEMQLLDADGDGRPSWAAVFAEAGYSEQVGLSQQVDLVAGALDLSVAVGVQQTNNGSLGVVSLLFDGLVVAQLDFSAPGVVSHHATLRASLPSVSAGRHEVRLMVERGMASSWGTPRQSFDDVTLSGTAVATAPRAPTSSTAARSTSGARITWTDTSTNERAFRIERSPPGGGSFVEVGRAAAGATSFIDATATSTGAYDYRVFATNEGGDSAASDVASIR